MTKKLKTTALAVALALGAVLGFGFSGGQALASDRADIEATVKNYIRELNAGNTDAIMRLITDDAVLMSPNNLPKEGIENIRAFYAKGLEGASINVDLTIQQVVPMTDDWAYVRSTSASSITFKSDGAVISGTNAELFILHNDNGWKIAQYIFATTDPRRRCPAKRRCHFGLVWIDIIR